MTAAERDDRDLIAAEYVLGTLAPEEARAFERQLESDAAARRRLAAWEQRLAALGLDLDPVEPPAYVWDSVLRAIGIAANNDKNPETSAAAPAARDARGTRRWRGLAIAASIIALVLAGLWTSQVPVWWQQPSEPSFASMIHDKDSGTSWLVTSSDNGKKLLVQAMGNYSVPSDKMLRMWILPPDGQPQLVGQLPYKQGRYTMPLSNSARAKLSGDSRIAVSLEDRSRAGTTKPGGEILWVTPVAHRTG